MARQLPCSDIDERVQRNAACQVEPKHDTPSRGGTTCRVMRPTALMQRHAAGARDVRLSRECAVPVGHGAEGVEDQGPGAGRIEAIDVNFG